MMMLFAEDKENKILAIDKILANILSIGCPVTAILPSKLISQ